MTAHLDIVHGDDGWFWRYAAKNGKELARSSETYKRQRGAERSAATVTGAQGLASDDFAVRVLDERSAT